YPIGPARVLNPKFPHPAVAGPVDPGTVRKRQLRPSGFEQSDDGIDVDLFRLAERFPPSLELIRVLDIPCHEWNIESKEYLVKDPGHSHQHGNPAFPSGNIGICCHLVTRIHSDPMTGTRVSNPTRLPERYSGATARPGPS